MEIYLFIIERINRLHNACGLNQIGVQLAHADVFKIILPKKKYYRYKHSEWIGYITRLSVYRIINICLCKQTNNILQYAIFCIDFMYKYIT